MKGVTDRLTVFFCATFLMCCVTACCWSDFLNRLSVSRVIWSVTHPLQFRAKISKPHRREGEEIEFPPLKDRPPNPHQQGLRESAVHQVSSASVVQPIRFLLLHTLLWHAWAHMQTYYTACDKNGAVTWAHIHTHTQINTHTIKQMQTYVHTQS